MERRCSSKTWRTRCKRFQSQPYDAAAQAGAAADKAAKEGGNTNEQKAQVYRRDSETTASEPPPRMKTKPYEKEPCPVAGGIGAATGLGREVRRADRHHLRRTRRGGQGGLIKRITEKVSPRVFRVVALPIAQRPREKPDIHATLHLATARGRRDRHFRPQLVHRPGVERVMGFTTEDKVRSFLKGLPSSRTGSSNRAFYCGKYFLNVSEEEQERRFLQASTIRCDNGNLARWTSSPIASEGLHRGLCRYDPRDGYRGGALVDDRLERQEARASTRSRIC